MNKTTKPARLAILLIGLTLFSMEARAFDYSYAAQKGLIPKELGKVYLGMPFREFAAEVPIGKAVVNSIQFDWLEFTVPVNGKNVESVRVRVHGLSREDKALMLVSESVSDSDEEVDRILISSIPRHSFVYAMYVKFNTKFKLKSYALKTYGKTGVFRKDDAPEHSYDIEWKKETADGLKLIVRSLHTGDKRELHLLGRITNTEWAVD